MTHEETLVVKLGGNAISDGALLTDLAQDLVHLQTKYNVVLVHGGGPQIDVALEAAGIPKKDPHLGLRITEPRAIPVIKQALGEVRSTLVDLLRSFDGNAVGLAGDENVLTAVKHEAADILQSVGVVAKVNTSAIQRHFDAGSIVVISTLASMKSGDVLNVNADPAAAAIAAELHAERFILLTNVPGIYEDFANKDSLVRTTDSKKIGAMYDTAHDKVKPKIDACLIALRGGVEVVDVIDGALPHAVERAMDSEEIGTRIFLNEQRQNFGPQGTLVDDDVRVSEIGLGHW